MCIKKYSSTSYLRMGQVWNGCLYIKYRSSSQENKAEECEKLTDYNSLLTCNRKSWEVQIFASMAIGPSELISVFLLCMFACVDNAIPSTLASTMSLMLYVVESVVRGHYMYVYKDIWDASARMGSIGNRVDPFAVAAVRGNIVKCKIFCSFYFCTGRHHAKYTKICTDSKFPAIRYSIAKCISTKPENFDFLFLLLGRHE